jgi:hypothetical protein
LTTVTAVPFQVQTPSRQVPFTGQTTPQPPQFRQSWRVSMHASPQRVWPGGHGQMPSAGGRPVEAHRQRSREETLPGGQAASAERSPVHSPTPAAAAPRSSVRRDVTPELREAANRRAIASSRSWSIDGLPSANDERREVTGARISASSCCPPSFDLVPGSSRAQPQTRWPRSASKSQPRLQHGSAATQG